MLGLIQKLLIDLVTSAGGSEAAFEVKRRAGVPEDRTFDLGAVYDDEEFQRLFVSTCEVLNITQEQAEKAYADFFCEDALERWPMWFQMAKNAREFLEQQPLIHNGFATSVQNEEDRKAITDKFKLEGRGNELAIHYRSPNRMCGLYMALAQWIIDHYGDEASIEEAQCLKDGAPECEIHVLWGKDDRNS